MRIVQVVRRADADVVCALFRRSSLDLLKVAVETLHLSKELRIKKVAIQHADGIIGIAGRNQPIARVANRPHVPGSNKPCGPHQCEVLTHWLHGSTCGCRSALGLDGNKRTNCQNAFAETA